MTTQIKSGISFASILHPGDVYHTPPHILLLLVTNYKSFATAAIAIQSMNLELYQIADSINTANWLYITLK